MGFGFAPKSWALCNGQTLPINQNQALFALLGTTYGGNGSTNFALPDLRGRAPTHFGNGHNLGERSGETSHTLTTAETPAHGHTAQAASANAAVSLPTNNSLASFLNGYTAPTALVAIHPQTIASVGGGQAHENMAPFLTLNFCIALQGIFPSQN
jgi:microcystin-dependent protein